MPDEELLAAVLKARESVPVDEYGCPDDCAPDCDERTTCDVVGVPGHWQCGACPEHVQPRHHCGCFATRNETQP